MERWSIECAHYKGAVWAASSLELLGRARLYKAAAGYFLEFLSSKEDFLLFLFLDLDIIGKKILAPKLRSVQRTGWSSPIAGWSFGNIYFRKWLTGLFNSLLFFSSSSSRQVRLLICNNITMYEIHKRTWSISSNCTARVDIILKVKLLYYAWN